MGKPLDLVDREFGMLKVISEAEHKRNSCGKSIRMWNCKCECGRLKILSTRELTSGNTKSCGNHKGELVAKNNITHGLSKTKLYRVWRGMKERCFKENNSSYKDYGGRGITVCDEWLHDFQAFYDWAMANGYKENLTIERKDVNGDYCPENCTWIPQNEQSRNKTNCHYIEYKGEVKTLSEWSRELHVDRGMVRKWEKILGSGEKAVEYLLNSPRHHSIVRAKATTET